MLSQWPKGKGGPSQSDGIIRREHARHTRGRKNDLRFTPQGGAGKHSKLGAAKAQGSCFPWEELLPTLAHPRLQETGKERRKITIN